VLEKFSGDVSGATKCHPSCEKGKSRSLTAKSVVRDDNVGTQDEKRGPRGEEKFLVVTLLEMTGAEVEENRTDLKTGHYEDEEKRTGLKTRHYKAKRKARV